MVYYTRRSEVNMKESSPSYLRVPGSNTVRLAQWPALLSAEPSHWSRFGLRWAASTGLTLTAILLPQRALSAGVKRA